MELEIEIMNCKNRISGLKEDNEIIAAYLELAELYIKDSKYIFSIECCEAVLLYDANNEDAILTIYNCMLCLNEYDKLKEMIVERLSNSTTLDLINKILNFSRTKELFNLHVSIFSILLDLDNKDILKYMYSFFIESKDFQKALDVIEGMISITSDVRKTNLIYLRGWLKLCLEKNDEALIDLLEYDTIHKNKADAHYFISSIYFKDGKNSEALKYINSYLKKKECDFKSSALLIKASIYKAQGKSTKYYELLDELLVTYPKDIMVIENILESYLETKSYKKIIKFLKPIYEEFKENVYINYCAAKANYHEKKYKIAIKYYEMFSEIEKYEHSFFELGYCYFRNSEYENAITFLGKALNLNNDSEDAISLLITCYKKINDVKKQISFYTLLICTNEEWKYKAMRYYEQLLISRSEAYLKIKQYDKAINDVNDAINEYYNKDKTSSHPVSYYIYLGLLHFKNNNTKECIKILLNWLGKDESSFHMYLSNIGNEVLGEFKEITIEQIDNSYNSLVEAAKVNHYLGNFNKTIELLTSAVEMKKETEFIYLLAESYERVKNNEKALYFYLEIIGLNLNDIFTQETFYKLAHVYFKLNDISNAMFYLTKARNTNCFYIETYIIMTKIYFAVNDVNEISKLNRNSHFPILTEFYDALCKYKNGNISDSLFTFNSILKDIKRDKRNNLYKCYIDEVISFIIIECNKYIAEHKFEEVDIKITIPKLKKPVNIVSTKVYRIYNEIRKFVFEIKMEQSVLIDRVNGLDRSLNDLIRIGLDDLLVGTNANFAEMYESFTYKSERHFNFLNDLFNTFDVQQKIDFNEFIQHTIEIRIVFDNLKQKVNENRNSNMNYTKIYKEEVTKIINKMNEMYDKANAYTDIGYKK